MTEHTFCDLCSREREMLYHLELDMTDEWEKSFNFAHKERDSYYVPQDKHEYLTEYNFETVPQLKEMVDRLWENEQYMQDIERTVLAAAIKSKPKQEVRESVERDTDGYMPEFIYNF